MSERDGASNGEMNPGFGRTPEFVPELDGEIEPVRPRRTRKWIVAFFASLVAVGMVVSLTGVWQLIGSDGQEAPTVSSLNLEVSEVRAGNFGAQTPSWADCGDGFVCADVQAPLDWSAADGETITLRMVKQPAKGSAPLGTLFLNPGGPGASGADYVRYSLDYSIGAALQDNYDIVGWDPRGVGASSPVSCFDRKGMDEFLFGGDDAAAGFERGSDEWIAVATAESREFGGACVRNTGALLGFVDTMSTVHDLDMLREIVGDEQLNYLGFSYGTYIGARYADTYPHKVGRFVLDGAIDPATTLDEVVREQTRGFELALRAFVESCLTDKGCPLPGAGTERPTDAAVDAAMAHIGGLLDTVDTDPLTGSDGRMLSSGTLLTAIITPLYSPDSWGYLNQLFESVASGRADIGLALADAYYGRLNGVYADNSTEAFSAINCLDYPNDADPARMRAEAKLLEEIAPTIGRFQGYGGLSCAGWPYDGVAARTAVTGDDAAPILVIGTTGDPATPYRWAVSLAEQLESGVLLSYEGEGHTAYGKNTCVNAEVDRFFVDGVVPQEGQTCR